MLPKDDFQSGQRLGAGDLNAIVEELGRLGRMAGAAPVAVSSGPGGTVVSVALPASFFIRLTAGGAAGKYTWERVNGVPGGTFATAAGNENGTAAGSDPAREVNGNTTVDLSPNPIVRAWRDPTSDALFFLSGSC